MADINVLSLKRTWHTAAACLLSELARKELWEFLLGCVFDLGLIPLGYRAAAPRHHPAAVALSGPHLSSSLQEGHPVPNVLEAGAEAGRALWATRNVEVRDEL